MPSKSFIYLTICILIGYIIFQSYVLNKYEEIIDKQDNTIDSLLGIRYGNL